MNLVVLKKQNTGQSLKDLVSEVKNRNAQIVFCKVELKEFSSF